MEWEHTCAGSALRGNPAGFDKSDDVLDRAGGRKCQLRKMIPKTLRAMTLLIHLGIPSAWCGGACHNTCTQQK